MPSNHDSYAALRYPDFRNYLSARVLASLGSMMETVAIDWQIYDRTHSAIALGMIGLVSGLPALAIGLFAGQVADRHERHRILVLTRLALTVSSVALFLITRADAGVPYSLYLVLFCQGIAGGFQGPAGSAYMAELVPSSVFANAIGWRTTLFQVSSLAGPAIGGVLLARRHDPADVYVVDAVLGLIGLLALFAVRKRSELSRSSDEPVWQRVLSGVRFVRHRPVILGAMTLDLFAVLFGGAVALLPIFAREVLRVGPEGLGILRAAPSAGAIVMALLVVHRPPIRRTGRTLFLVVATFGLAMIGFGLSRSLLLSLGFLALSGAMDNVSMVIRGTILQSSTPNAMRGRVSSVNGLFVGASNELGGFESGLTAQWMGAVGSVVFGGTMTLIVAAISAWKFPELRRLGSPDSLEEDSEP